MKILITGASSFSGAFIIRQLAASGHEVVATYRQDLSEYDGIRGKRAQMAAQHCRPIYGVSFGDEAFLELVKNESFDVYGHHGAWTKNYRSMDYEFHNAFVNNTRNVQQILASLATNGCHRVVISASVFEGDCGLSSSVDVPFSPHGLVKQFTSKTFDFYGRLNGMHVSRFVIPNPFGALDNPKLIDYLCREWYANRKPQIRTPLYIRDNIHVELLAKAYVYWVENMSAQKSVFAPCGYVSSMADFVDLVAKEMRPRLGLSCDFGLGTQSDFTQPMILVNDTPVSHLFNDWDSAKAWDALAQYQQEKHNA